MINVIALIISLLPAVFIYLYIKGRILNEEKQKVNCREAMKQGLLCAVFIVPLSLVLNILIALMKLDRIHPLLKEAVYNFIVLAFSEEFIKRRMLKKVEDKNGECFSGLETVCYMIIVGFGFEINESILYSFSTNVIQIFVRGILMMHGIFGYIMGSYLAKSRENHSKKDAILSFVLPWLFHGAYDFSLSEELLEISDFFVLLPFALVLVNIILMVKMFLFLYREGRKRKQAADTNG